MMFDKEWDYVGQMDHKGQACGRGLAKCKDEKCEGYFFNDLPHGIRKEFLCV